MNFSVLAGVLAAAALAVGQAQASSTSPTISQARHFLMRYAIHQYHGFTWHRHLGPCKRRLVFSRTTGTRTPQVSCRLSQYAESNANPRSNHPLFVGTVVQQWTVYSVGAGLPLHGFLVRQRQTPLLPLQFSVTIDPSVQQSSGYDASGNWWSAVYTFRAGASAGTMNLVDARELPNGLVKFSAPGGSYGAGDPQGCSYRVGSGVSTQSCLIVYRQPGTYQVTAQYAPYGASPVSVTESETIG